MHSAQQFINSRILAGAATAAITVYRFVKHGTTAAGAVKFTAAAAGEAAVGVSVNATANAGEAVGAALEGIGLLEVNAASANIVAGDMLVPSTGGIGIKSTTGVGYAEALEPATADGVKIRVLIRSLNAGQRAVVVSSASATAMAVTAAQLAGGRVLAINTTAGVAALAIPAAASVPGAELTLKKTGSAGAVTITPAAGTIGGGSTHTACDAQNDTATFVAVGADWVLTHSNLA